MMTDMKTTTPCAAKVATKTPPPRRPSATVSVRDLNRQPAAVLKMCDDAGEVSIRARNGRAYVLRPQSPAPAIVRPDSFAERQRAYRDALRKLGVRPATREETERIHRIIAGEE